MLQILKKRWVDILIGIILLLVLIPQTRLPIQVHLQRLIALAPSINPENEQVKLNDYNLSFADQEGKVYPLNNARGKLIILNFWATWCPPCIAEMPSLQQLYQDYGNQVSFYFITQDSWELINKFKQQRHIELPFYKLKQASTALDHTSLPTTYIIDQSGKILVKKVGVADWNSSTVRDLLDQALIQK